MKYLLLSLLMPLSAVAEKAPNFIIYYIDDLGWSDTSVAMMDSEPESKSDFYQTPHLEALAARGMRFSNGYAPAPTCTPSRKSIQFGKTPARLQYTFVNDVLASKRGLSWSDEVSMADVLKNSGKGYVTAHFGKGMGKDRMDIIGYDVTDEHGPSGNGNGTGDYLNNKTREPVPADNPKRMKSLETSSVKFVREHAGKKPFYMMVSHYAVHVVHHAREELIEKYRNLPRGKYCRDADYLPVEEMTESFRQVAWRLQYAAMIEDIDIGLGKIVEELKATGELDNTYIIFTSDNGGGMRPNGPLGWGKAQLYEGGLRVPWVVAGPGVKAGVQCDEPVVQWDLLPTLHDLSGSSELLPEDLDGGSLRDLFAKGNAGAVKRPEEGLVFHYPCYFAPPLSVIRIGDYKYMKHLLTGEAQLYDLSKDIGENNDIVSQMPEKAAEMDKVLAKYLKDVDAEDVQDMYKIRLEVIDRGIKQANSKYESAVAKLNPAKDADKITQLKKKRAVDLERHAKSQKQIEVNRKSSHWAGSPAATKS